MGASYVKGIAVDGQLGSLMGYRPEHGRRLLDLRLVSDAYGSILSDFAPTADDTVVVPLSRLGELPPSAATVAIWCSPRCDRAGLSAALSQPRCGLFATCASDFEAIARPNTPVFLTGWEGAGIVAGESTLVFLRRALAVCDGPVFVVGGLGPDASAGAVAAGAAGVFLSDVLWATPQAGADAGLIGLLERFDPSDTVGLGRHFDFECRVYAQLATKAPRAFADIELRPETDAGTAWEALQSSIGGHDGVNLTQDLVPMAQTSVLARELRDRFGHADAILAHYDHVIATALNGIVDDYPFSRGGRLAERFGVANPLFQGAMSQVSDVPAFADAMERAGAMPWLAFSNTPDYIVEPLLAETLAVMGERSFGVNLIGMDSNRYRDAHLDLVCAERPRFAMVAAGTVEQALRLESHGITTVLHTPVPAMLRTALHSGLRHFVLEGAEAGGHVGKLGMTALVQSAIDLLLAEAQDGLDLAEVSVVVAGGISDQRAAHFCAAMLYRLHDLGAAVGLQLGTAYLLTAEAVESGAITPVFQQVARDASQTELLGRTVRTPTRVLATAAARRVRSHEDERLRDRLDLATRKEHYEDDNFGGLRAAAKAQRVEFTDETRKHTRLVGISEAEQRDLGLFHAGQTVALCDRVRPAAELNRELTTGPGASQEATTMSRTKSAMDSKQRAKAIAIVGIGAKVPGALSVADFWSNISNGRTSLGEVPIEAWDATKYWSDDRKAPDRTYSKIGGFVRGFEFDRKRFRIPPTVVRSLDPTQQLALAATADALQDANLLDADCDRSRCAVILGNSGGDLREKTDLRVHFPKVADALVASAQEEGLTPDAIGRLVERTEATLKDALPPITEDSMPGELANVVAGRISNVFNLGGPSYTADAACASTMAAVHAAVRGLRDHSFDVCVTGGADRAMSPAAYTKFSKIGALSATGSRPFDAGADGFVMAEGAVILVLKRLDDAVANGDRVYAVIRGVGGASDGRGKGITAPNPAGQVRALRSAYDDAGIDPTTVGLFEAHGTSTRVGDVVEVSSFARLFEHDRPAAPIAIGSVKSNIGHLKAAAGAAGLAKAALALHHGIKPPTCSVETLNPNIDFEAACVSPQLKAERWERNGHPRRAGVSAFGFGGTNFHAVLEAYGDVPDERRRERPSPPTPRSATGSSMHAQPSVSPSLSVALSAPSRDALLERLAALVDSLAADSDAAVAANTLDLSNRPEAHRLALVAADGPSLHKLASKALAALRAGKSFRVLENRGAYYRCDGAEPGRVAFLFTGQGSQYLDMGADLMAGHPEVARWFERADAAVGDLLDTPLSTMVFSDATEGVERAAAFRQLSHTAVTQPAVLTLDLALLDILASRGLRPDVVAGHSLGEYGACVAAGVLDGADAIRTVAVRGRAMADAQPDGADCGVMASIALDADEVRAQLTQFGGRVAVANENSASQTIIAGYTPETEAAIAHFDQMDVGTQRLSVSHAFHSDIVAPAAEPLAEHLAQIEVSSPELPIYSNVSASPYRGDVGEVRAQLTAQVAAPVRWRETIENMYRDGVRTFIEVGPKRALATFVADTLEGRPHRSYPSNHPKFGGPLSLARLTAALWADGVFSREQDANVVPPPVTEVPTAAASPAMGGMMAWAAAALAAEPPSHSPAAAADPVSGVPFEGAAPAVGFDEAYGALLDELCIKTGYDREEIEPEFELEADLGVDTVKQAEIMAAVREHFELQRDETFRLADHPTLKDLAHYIVARSSEPATGEQVDRPDDNAAPVTVATIRFDQAYGALLDELCLKTGYDRDEIEPEFELEADLGVDTVKQAEIMAAVREHFALARDDTFRLADYPTLKDLADYIVSGSLTTAVEPDQPDAPALEAAPVATSMSLDLTMPVLDPEPIRPEAEAVSFGEAYDALLDELCVKTGYDKAEIEPGFELEADLGVDTVKQAEIMAAVREQFTLPRDDSFRLADYPTLNDLADYIVHASGVSAPQPSASAPSEPASDMVLNLSLPEFAAEPATSGAAVPLDVAYDALLDELCLKTGYDKAEIEPEFELEADLGVDTVKQAEIMAAVREHFDLPRDESFRLADYPTLQNLAEYVASHTGAVAVAPPTLVPVDDAQPSMTLSLEMPTFDEPRAPTGELPTASEDEVYQVMLRELSRRTGYDAGEIAPEFELEADLGVDTVKQAEIMSAVLEHFALPRDEEFRLADYPTLADLTGYLAARLASRSAGQAVTIATPKTDVVPAFGGRFGPWMIQAVPGDSVSYDEARLRALFSGRRVALIDVERGMLRPLRAVLSELGAIPFVVEGQTEADIAQDLSALESAEQLAVVMCAGTGDPSESMLHAFRLARAVCGVVPEDAWSRTPWLTITRAGGQMGLDGGGSASAGAATGATKALARELESRVVRAVDLAEESVTTEYVQNVLAQAFLGDALSCGYAFGRRFEATETVVEAAPASRPLGPNDVVLVTGGARGVTARVAIEMSRRLGVKLALLGRSQFDSDLAAQDLAEAKEQARQSLAARYDKVTPAMVRDAVLPVVRAKQVAETLSEIRASGSEVVYLSADVTDARAVQTACDRIRARLGRISAVVHGAGVEVSKALSAKSEAEAHRVVATKVSAVPHLLAATVDDDLAAFVTFGSVAGRFGNAGQFDYAAANDGLSQQMCRLAFQSGVRALNIAWTAWDDVGMAVDGGTRAFMSQRGIDLLPADEGAALCVDLLCSSAAGEVLVAGGLGDLRRLPGADHWLAEADVAPSAEAGLLTSVQIEPDRSSARALVTLRADLPFLNDHRIDGTPILPGVMGVEVAAQLSALLADGAPFLGVDDMRFERPAKLHRDEPLELMVEARRAEGQDACARFQVSIGSRRVSSTGRVLETEHFAGTLRFGQTKEPATPPLRLIGDDSVCHGWSREEVYNRFFHTGTFALITELVAVGDTLAVSEGSITDSPLISDDADLLTAPLATELAFQTGGLNGLTRHGSMWLPARIGRSNIWRRPESGHSLTTRTAIREVSDTHLVFDAEVITREGLLVATYEGVELINAGQQLDAVPVLRPMALIQATADVTSLEEGELSRPADLAAPGELAAFDRKRSERARQEWVLSRKLLKRLVGDYYRWFSGVALEPTQIKIVKDKYGAPTLEILDASVVLESTPHMTLSHSVGRVVVALVPAWRAALAGIDLERIEDRSARFLSDNFTGHERRVAQQVGESASTFTAMWSLKEAASKALGMGTHLDFRNEIQVTGMGTHDAEIRFDGEARRRLERLGYGEIRAQWAVENGFATAQVELTTL